MARGKQGYKKEYCTILRNASSMGMTVPEMSELMGITKKTFYVWCNTYPEFMEAYTDGKEHSNKRVLMSLYEAAVTGTVTTKTKRVTNLTTMDVVETVETIHTPPTHPTMAYWLTNRMPTDWNTNRLKEIAPEIPEDVAHEITMTVINTNHNEN